ncbi:MAG: gamma-glutamyltransferase family protein [Thermomicrobiales bacterium]|nr:gamma-glutamyltransferase family protein [Thermomicrobiales bacterium]
MAWPNRGLSHRSVAVGARGMVASAHPAATLAGLQMLQRGGNAVDAIIATAAALNVAEPYMSGIGGVGYLLSFQASDRALRVLNYNGTAPKAAFPDAFRNRREQEHGPKSPMIPAAAGGWLTALETAGRLDPATVFAPAIDLAETGVPLTPKGEYFYRNSINGGHLDGPTKAVFFPGDRVPPAGTVIRQPKLAATFRDVVAGGMDVFYRGAIADEIVRAVQAQGGLLGADDLAEFQPFWQETISAGYRGYRVHSAPPPCSGIQYLEALALLEPYDLAGMGQNSPESIHLIAEAFKLAGADRIAYAPLAADCPTEDLLSPAYLDRRREEIQPDMAGSSPGERFDGRLTSGTSITAGEVRGKHKVPESTTHFCVIDADGNAAAITQSLGDGFGSGVMAGETGLMLNNFNFWFDSDRESPNLIGPGKTIEMCMAPAAMTHADGRLFGMIGTPGSFGIVQTTPQMIMNLLDHGFSIQAAIEAPRFRAYERTILEMEARIPKTTRDELARKGHEIRLIDDWSFLVGGGQGVMIDPDTGARFGGADPRRDGVALGY